MSVLDAALRRAAQGFQVFPCKADKSPACAGGFKDASRDAAVIRDLFSHPDAAIVGLPTGQINGWDVVDLDERNGAASHALWNSPPKTRTHFTRSGGLHLFFRHAPGVGCNQGRLGLGLDVRGDGGYVCDWPSSGTDALHEGILLDWPADLLALATAPKPRTERATRIDRAVNAPSKEAARQALADAVSTIEAAPDGTKHDTILRLSMRIARLVNGGFLDEDEAHDAIYDAAERAGSADMMNVENSWSSAIEKATPAEVNDGSELGPLPDEIVVNRDGRRMRLASDLKLAAAQPYIVKGLIRQGDVGIILGAPGAGKSMLAPLIGYRIALGLPVFGMRSRQGRVLYAVAEDAHGMDHRIMALRSEHGTTDDFAVVTIENLGDKVEADALMADVRNWQPSVVIIDTLAAAWAGMVENDSADMGKVVEFARRIAATGAGVILIHHPAKNTDGSPRGHSSLNGTADWTLLLGDRTEEGIVRCKVTKNRAGRSDLDISFSQRSVKLGRDEDGEPVTAPMAVELPARPFDQRKPEKRLPASLDIALQTLTDAIDAADGQPVSVELWKKAVLNDGVFGLDGNKFRSNFSRAKRDLIARKLVMVDEKGVASVPKQAIQAMLRPSLADLTDDAPQH